MNMYNFAIIEPVVLDWRRVAPHSFESLELFLNPQVSVLLKDIVNAKGEPFNIGAYMLNDAGAKEKFDKEIMTQRNFERIEKAFKDESISAFFSYEEGLQLTKTFEDEKFIVKRVEVCVSGRRVSLFDVSSEVFNLVTDEFVKMKVVNIVDFTTQADTWQKTIKEIEERAYQRAAKEMQDKDANRLKDAKKRIIKRASIGVGIGVATLVAGALAKKYQQGSTAMKIVGGALVIASWAGTSLSKNYLGKSMNDVEGVLIK